MEINEHIIKFVGKAYIPEALILGNSYKVKIDGEITSITNSNNQDNTKNIYYRFEPIIADRKSTRLNSSHTT